MHEVSLAEAVMRELTRLTEVHRLVRISRVVLKVGELRSVVPEAMAMALRAAAGGTVAQDAQFELLQTPAVARCRPCGQEFHPSADSFLCPCCHRSEVEITSGWELVIELIEGDVEDQ